MTNSKHTSPVDIYDALDKKTSQVMALISLLSTHNDIGHHDSKLINQSLWALTDMLKDIQQLQQLFFEHIQSK